MSREYDTDKYLYNSGVTVMAAVLLFAVASTGYLLMTGDGMTYQIFAMTLVSLFALICFVASLARGSQSCKPARASSVPPSAPEQQPLRLVPPVQEATYVDQLHDIRLPFDEAVGLDVIHV